MGFEEAWEAGFLAEKAALRASAAPFVAHVPSSVRPSASTAPVSIERRKGGTRPRPVEVSKATRKLPEEESPRTNWMMVLWSLQTMTRMDRTLLPNQDVWSLYSYSDSSAKKAQPLARIRPPADGCRRVASAADVRPAFFARSLEPDPSNGACVWPAVCRHGRANRSSLIATWTCA